MTTNVCKKVLIKNIVKSFEKRCHELTLKSNSDLLDLYYTKAWIVRKHLRSTIIATIILNEYGSEILNSFCKPDELNLNIILTEACNLPWLHETSLVSHQYLNSAGIKSIFMHIHPAQRPTIGKIFNDLSLTLTLTS